MNRNASRQRCESKTNQDFRRVYARRRIPPQKSTCSFNRPNSTFYHWYLLFINKSATRAKVIRETARGVIDA